MKFLGRHMPGLEQYHRLLVRSGITARRGTFVLNKALTLRHKRRTYSMKFHVDDGKIYDVTVPKKHDGFNNQALAKLGRC